MGEMEWIVGGSWHKRDDCPSKSGILCGSLPPRKRLLAGLKQNGFPASDTYLLSSDLLQNISNNINVRDVNSWSVPAWAEAPSNQDVNLVMDMDDVKRVRSDCDEIIKHKFETVIPRSYNSCTDVHTKGPLCFYCLKVCKDPSVLSDSAIWLICRSCERYIHSKCELRFSPGLPLDSTTYVCFACSHPKVHQERGVSGRDEKSSFANGRGADGADGSCSSTVSFEMFRSSIKKQRMTRKRRKKPMTFCIENIRQSPSEPESFHRQGHPEQVIALASEVNEEYELLVRKSAAMLAAKVALTARARASVKAIAAVKAAAVAKAALEAAALAARASESCRRSTLTEANCEVSLILKSDEITADSNGATVIENSNTLSSRSHASSHDENSIHPLHRAMNTSPRISHCITQTRTKASEGAGFELTAENFTTSAEACSMSAFDLSNQQATTMPIPTTLMGIGKPHSFKTRIHKEYIPLKTKDSSSIPFTVLTEDSSLQAVQCKAENNFSPLVCADYPRNLSNYNGEVSVPANCSISKLEREAPAAVETKVVNFDRDLQKIDNPGKVEDKISVDMGPTLTDSDSDVKEAIATQPPVSESTAGKNTGEHTETIQSSSKALISAALVEKQEVGLAKGYSILGKSHKHVLNGISPPRVDSNLPIEITCCQLANRSCSKSGAKRSFEDRQEEHSCHNIAAHLNFEKAALLLDLSQKISRHGLTGGGTKFGVSEVEPAKKLCDSFFKLKSDVRTLTEPVSPGFVHTPTVSAMSSSHY